MGPHLKSDVAYWVQALCWFATVAAAVAASYTLQVMLLRARTRAASPQEMCFAADDNWMHKCHGVGTLPRLLAVGDLHGDFENALATLALTGAVDGAGNWIGGCSILVQTGDVMDRGRSSVALLDLFAGLKAQAAAAGGRVVTLLGNHELMNLQGHSTYVHPDELAEYGRDRWHRDFSPDGVRGAILAAGSPAAVVAGEGPCRSLFVHGGLLPKFAKKGALEALGEEVGTALRRRKWGSKLLGESGPFWYRGYAQDREAKVCPLVRKTLKKVNATRMLIGHTIEDERITTRCGGALVLLDVGISSAYFGRQAAWECDASGRSNALYPGGRHELPVPS